MYLCVSGGGKGGQKRALAHLELELQVKELLQLHCGSWESNSGPLQGQYVLLNIEPNKPHHWGVVKSWVLHH